MTDWVKHVANDIGSVRKTVDVYEAHVLTLSYEVPQVYLPPAPPFFVLPVPFLDCDDLQQTKSNKALWQHLKGEAGGNTTMATYHGQLVNLWKYDFMLGSAALSCRFLQLGVCAS